MGWSYRIARFAGIDIYVHATFILLLAWIGISHWLQTRSLVETLVGVAFILALFACVVLHEYGHALTARRFGVPTRDITLLPIGGVARLERIPDDPRQELWVAAAGPAVNVVIAAGLAAWLSSTNGFQPIEELGVARGSFAERLLIANVFLVLFNLVPAFPMDGGRVLRALLAMHLPRPRATRIAASVGQAIALVFGFLGLFSNPFLLFIALFVWIGAAQEASAVDTRSALAGVSIRQLMQTEFRTLRGHELLARAVELTLAGSQKDFPVLEDGRLVGVLTQSSMLEGLHRLGPGAPIEQVMERDFAVAELFEPAEEAFSRLQGCACNTLPVTDRGELVGLLTMENVGELLAIRAALSSPSTAEPAPRPT